MNKVLKLRLKAAAITLTIATVVPLLVFALFTNPAFIVWLIMLGVAVLVVVVVFVVMCCRGLCDAPQCRLTEQHRLNLFMLYL